MKALAILPACLALLAAAPASAFVQIGVAPHGAHGGFPHGPGSHPGFPHPGFHHRHGGAVFLGGAADFTAPLPPEAEPASAPDESQFAPELPLVIPSPAPLCPPAPASAPRVGPHIIYIGHQPTVHGPKVIYGTE